MSQVPSDHRPGYLIKRVQQLIRQACDERLRVTGVSMAQYSVLRQLADRPGASSAELARRCFVTRQSLQDMLGGLRAAEMVTVAERPASGRSRPVTLTPTGRTRLAAAENVVTAVEKRMLSGLDATDCERLGALLATCATNLSGESSAR